jgi:hypothetical protein
VVQGLQQQGHVVAFVGDGLNDTLAMAAADVGVAVGQSYRFVLFVLAASAPSSCTYTSVFDYTACFWMPLMLCLPRGASATSQQCFTSGMQFIHFPMYAQQLFSISNMHLASPPVCSHVTFRRILMNIAWATLYNFLMIPLAAGVFYPRCATPSSSTSHSKVLTTRLLESKTFSYSLLQPPHSDAAVGKRTRHGSQQVGRATSSCRDAE